jgi:hypothetical protein
LLELRITPFATPAAAKPLAPKNIPPVIIKRIVKRNGIKFRMLILPF